MREVIADNGFSKRFQEFVRGVCRWAVSITEKATQGFVIQPRRWVVERTFAWLGRYRRLSRDFEHTVISSEAMVYLASIRRTLRIVTTEKAN